MQYRLIHVIKLVEINTVLNIYIYKNQNQLYHSTVLNYNYIVKL